MKTKKERIHEIIFEADTPEGKLFDVILMMAIVISVTVVMLDSVAYCSANRNHNSGNVTGTT